MTRVRFHDAALTKFAHEVKYYTEISPRLGERFAMAAEKAVAIATKFPDMDSPHKYGTRRAFPKRFPFSLVYLYRGGEVFILALSRPTIRSRGIGAHEWPRDSMSIYSDPQQLEAPSARVVVGRSSLRYPKISRGVTYGV